jgi:hypothetical protein
MLEGGGSGSGLGVRLGDAVERGGGFGVCLSDVRVGEKATGMTWGWYGLAFEFFEFS